MGRKLQWFWFKVRSSIDLEQFCRKTILNAFLMNTEAWFWQTRSSFYFKKWCSFLVQLGAVFWSSLVQFFGANWNEPIKHSLSIWFIRWMKQYISFEDDIILKVDKKFRVDSPQRICQKLKQNYYWSFIDDSNEREVEWRATSEY